jgi:hypothetical protein
MTGTELRAGYRKHRINPPSPLARRGLAAAYMICEIRPTFRTPETPLPSFSPTSPRVSHGRAVKVTYFVSFQRAPRPGTSR